MDELDFKGGLVGDFKKSPSVIDCNGQEQLLRVNSGNLSKSDGEEQRPFISKSPSNSSFGFDNTFRVLESQVSRDDTEINEPAIVTTLELELGAVARLQQFSYYSTPKSSRTARTLPSTPVSSTRPEDCDKYLEFLNQFIKKSRQKVTNGEKNKNGAECKSAISITVGDGDEDEEPGLVEFGEYPELVYCIAKDKTGRYRLQNKDRINSPQRPQDEGNSPTVSEEINFIIV